MVRLVGCTSMKIIAAAQAALDGMPIHSLSIAVIDDTQMSQLHAEFMGDPSPTDVLTFDLRDHAETEAIEGEIVVSADTARREAAQRKLAPEQELLRYVIHGVLHLRGMDDGSPSGRQQMRRAETRVLNELATSKTARRESTLHKSTRRETMSRKSMLSRKKH